MNTVDDIRERAQQLVESLLGQQVYVVFQSDNPPQNLLIPGALGVTSRTLDAALMEWLSNRGEWQGRRATIYIADVSIRRMANDYHVEAQSSCDELFDRMLTAVLCHELGHVAEAGVDLSEPTLGLQSFTKRIAACSIAIADGSMKDCYPPFFSHGPMFVRLALHAALRARRLGREFPIAYLFDSAAYGLPASPDEFEYALGDEPQRLISVPLLEVRTFRCWTNFSRLWERCVRYWLGQQTTYSPAVSRAIEMLQVD